MKIDIYRDRDAAIIAALIAIVAVCPLGFATVDESDAPKPTHSPTPIPTTSCYRAGWYWGSTPSPGGYRPCDHPQSIEDEERAHIDDLQQRQKAERLKQEEIDRAEYWEQVRRERLERERSGQTPGGPVTVPPPVPLPS